MILLEIASDQKSKANLLEHEITEMLENTEDHTVDCG